MLLGLQGAGGTEGAGGHYGFVAGGTMGVCVGGGGG